MKNADSWNFLREFYQFDNSIAFLIAQALGTQACEFIKTSNFDTFISSLFTSIGINDRSYSSLLEYVASEVNIDENADINDRESAFLSYIWSNICSNSPVRNHFHTNIKFGFDNEPYVPYLILYSLEIKIDWFPYGGLSTTFFSKGNDAFLMLINELKRGYQRWLKIWRWLSSLKKFVKFFRSKTITSTELYPLMILLIVLRREWEESYSVRYLKKYHSLFSRLSEPMISDAIIIALYEKYDDADSEIIEKINQTVNTENISDLVNQIKFHPVIARHIFESQSYKWLFEQRYIPEKFGEQRYMPERLELIEKISMYKYVEKELGDDFMGSRLLLDYMFPFTKVRKNDVFVPSPSAQLVDLIYLSIVKGKDWHQSWREPKSSELFDKIQIEPVRNWADEYSDKRVIPYRNHLSRNGGFLVVKSEADDKISKSLKDAFSDFRHDLKDLMSRTSISLLQDNLIATNAYVRKIRELLRLSEAFVDDSSNEELLEELRAALRNLENERKHNTKETDCLLDIIRAMRDNVEEYHYSRKENCIEMLAKENGNMRSAILDSWLENIAVQIDLTEKVGNTYDTLCSYIKLAGEPKINKNDKFSIGDFLSKYIKYMPLDLKRVQVVLGNSDTDYCIIYNKAILTIILNSIIDNAIDHGFKDYDCASPTIQLSWQYKGGYILLKVCNNGRPIDITSEDYKTRGVFSGLTGHTGLGGYQISKYAEMLGGYVELPKVKEWNTEINLYIKYDEK